MLTTLTFVMFAVGLAVHTASPLTAQDAQVSSNKKPPRPNILYFYVDDMGWGSIGPNGQDDRKSKNLPYVRTPNLNRLAAEGINFTRGYGCHVCSPARSSQQTGFHQGHTYADRNDPDNARKAIRSDDITMGDALSAAGYTTGYWGKWGYGGSKDQQNPQIVNVQTLPTSHGYQHVLAELHHVRAHTFFQPTLWKAPAKPGSTGDFELIPNSLANYKASDKYPNTPALQNHADYPKTAYCDDFYAFAALDFVREQAQNYNKTGQPFFGLLAVQIPHAPFGEVATLPEWNKVYEDDPQFASLADQTKYWAAMVTRIDGHFGNILAALEDPNNDGDKSDSVADNTLVIFQSDNGGPRGKNNDELNANGGLSGVKGKIQEGGIRVPLVMRWPAKINETSKLKPGFDFDKVVDVTDLLPTFCDLAGTETPLGIDGVSISPTLTGTGIQRQRNFIIHEASNGKSIIRGNGKFKLVKSKNSVELFDIKADPTESRNIAKQFPKVKQELLQLLLGERVDEPKGFANTYHHWTGKSEGLASNADNWSDYEYANAGVTYATDSGSPQLSWVAEVNNTSHGHSMTKVEKDLEFLAISIGGHTEKDLTHNLSLASGVNLTGRNEIRIKKHGVITLRQGKLKSLRWIDIQEGGQISGTGTLVAHVHNRGHIRFQGEDTEPGFKVKNDFFQFDTGTVHLMANGSPSMSVGGKAVLGGKLKLEIAKGFEIEKGKPHTIISADRVFKKFSNENDELTTKDGHRFKIQYEKKAVTISLM